MTAATFTINTPWPFIAVVACSIVGLLFVLYIEGRG